MAFSIHPGIRFKAIFKHCKKYIEAANLTKTLSAAENKIKDINYIISRTKIDFLPVELRQTAIYRIKYSQATLSEIGQKFSPPVSKSIICTRLKKISQIANKLRVKA